MVFCIFVILVISRFGFEVEVWFLIAPIPVHCFLLLSVCYILRLVSLFSLAEKI